MQIVLLRSTTVRGKQLLAGQELDVTDKEGKLWCALAWAKEKVFEENDTRNRYRRRDMRARD